MIHSTRLSKSGYATHRCRNLIWNPVFLVVDYLTRMPQRKVCAVYKDRVLKVHLPKTENRKLNPIEVKISENDGRRCAMFRHSHYLDVPWGVHWHRVGTGSHRHLWWLIALLVLLAMFLIGVGVTSGII